MKRILVTTALEQSWPYHEPVLFLGEWCCRYSRRSRWQAMDIKTLPYHWDNRTKLHTDYQYLQVFYERSLSELSNQLNQIHGVDHTIRYWRILIGPWLGYFIHILFDRWTTVQQAIGQYNLSKTIILTGNEHDLIPNDMSEFPDLFTSDRWNHYIYSTILQEFSSLPCVEQPWQDTNAQVKETSIVVSRKSRAKQVLLTWINQAASALMRDRDAFLISSYLPKLDEMKLHLHFRQIPQFRKGISPTQVEVDYNKRKWELNGDSESEFEVFARRMIPRQLPTAYFEGYEQLVQQSFALDWPKQPKFIWTSNSHIGDDVFKVWAAQKTEQGSPLVIGQHGGCYGIVESSFSEDHEIKICDSYLSWGWTAPQQPKIKPVGQLISKRPLDVRHVEQSQALLVTTTFPRYSYWLCSTPISGQWNSYFDEQCRFIESLPVLIRNVLIVRLCPPDYGWDQKAQWHDRFPDLTLDDAKSNIKNLIAKSRLCIATYNGTAFLELFTMNVPTVIYWNPNYWELRTSASPYFEALARVGLFHETPESAARHVVAIWDHVDVWWNSAPVRKVLERFIKNYSDSPAGLLNRIESELSGILKESKTYA